MYFIIKLELKAIFMDNNENSNRTNDSIKSNSISPLRRFEKSMEIDYEKWHDGIEYDIEAIRGASQQEHKAIVQILINHSPKDWRYIEALAEIKTKSAREIINSTMKDPEPDIRV